MSLPPPPARRQEITVSAGTAFKMGFFGFFGAVVASLILSAILTIGSLVLLIIGINIWGDT